MELRPSFSPDGRLIVFSSNRGGNWSIYTLEVATGHVNQISYLSENQFSGRFSPDGQSITFYSDYFGNPWTGGVDHDLFVADWDGGRLHRVFDDDASQILPDWTSDGKSLIFVSDHEGPRKIYRRPVQAEEAELESLTPNWTTGGIFNTRVHWLANAVFFDAPAPEGGNTELWRLDLADLAITRLSHNDIIEYGPNLSPDGTQIVFQTTDAEGGSQVAIMDSDGNNRRTLTNQSTNMTPAWSPDGRSIVFIRSIDEMESWATTRRNREIYIMDADGSSQRRLLAW